MIVAKTNMTEYAFSGVGMNPHFGTPGKSGRPRPHPRRLDLGRRRRGGGRHVRDRDRLRHRRLDAHPGRAVRYRRLQAEQAARADRGRLSALASRSTRSARWRNSVADCALADAVMAGEDMDAVRACRALRTAHRRVAGPRAVRHRRDRRAPLSGRADVAWQSRGAPERAKPLADQGHGGRECARRSCTARGLCHPPRAACPPRR